MGDATRTGATTGGTGTGGGGGVGGLSGFVVGSVGTMLNGIGATLVMAWCKKQSKRSAELTGFEREGEQQLRSTGAKRRR